MKRMTRPRLAGLCGKLVAIAFLCQCLLVRGASGAPRGCAGDWNGDGQTTVDEIVRAVNAALNGCEAPCPGDLNEDGATTIDEIVTAVGVVLNGCPATPSPTATSTPPIPTVTPTNTRAFTATPGSTEFVPVSVSSAVAKVKNLLVGLPPTDAEVAAVAADTSVLHDLVGEWVALPEYEQKMLGFFMTAFQQDQFGFADLQFQFVGRTPFANDERRIVQNLQQSFARTVLQLLAEGEPFTSAMTTRRFMMTPAVMALYATQDNLHNADNYSLTDLFRRDHPTSVTVQSSNMIPIEEVVDPNSPSFLTFFHPAIAAPYAPGCAYGTIFYPEPADIEVILSILYNYQAWFWPPNCFPPLVPRASRYIQDSDFTDWRMVTIRQPEAGEPTTLMYDLPAMRAGDELVLNVPRVSFFSTPAFAARWPTNDDNQARVLINQTLIVALGRPIDPTNPTSPPSLEALAAEHAPPATTCYSCHRALDPMRQFFRQNYTLYFSKQDDPQQLAMNGQFAFHGVSAESDNIFDLGALLATHPMLATGWVQKLCTYATSRICDERDPEFIRLVNVFRDSDYSWNALVQALFASPLVTYLEETKTTMTAGQSFPIARQAHLCTSLSNRLRVTDVCGLDAQTSDVNKTVATVAASWPSDAYSRGNQIPALASSPSLLMRGGMENLCAALALQLVDGPGGMFPSSNPPMAIDNLATQLMGLTGDRAAAPRMILQEHFAAAAVTASNSVALQSTFVLACLSPYVAEVGH